MLKRILTVLVFLLLGVGVAVAILLFSESDEISDVNVDRLIAEKVSVRTLSEEITISGEMRREELQSINSVSAGRLTSLELEEGDMVDAFTTLFTLDGRPSVSVNGDFSFYRELNVGSQGPDVEQLETILEMAGYEVGIVDQFYTEEFYKNLIDKKNQFKLIKDSVVLGSSPSDNYFSNLIHFLPRIFFINDRRINLTVHRNLSNKFRYFIKAVCALRGIEISYTFLDEGFYNFNNSTIPSFFNIIFVIAVRNLLT